MSWSGHILGIEISNPGAGVREGSGPSVAMGRVSGGAFEAVEREWLRMPPAGSRGGIDDDLMPAMARMFERAGMMAREVLRGGRVAVSVGPGGYTSVRIACAAGKMIAEGSGAACVSVGTELALYRAARRERVDGVIAVALAGKGEGAWVRVMNARAGEEAGRVVDAAGFREMCERAGVKVLVADEHVPAGVRAAAGLMGVAVVAPVYDAMVVAELGAESGTCDGAELNPVYPREPDAVTQWRARKG